MKKICLILLLISSVAYSQNVYPTTGNVKIFAVDQNWAEGIAIVKPSGWSGIRFTRYDPAIGPWNGNWAMGYNANTGNDFSITSNDNAGVLHNGVFHISNATRNVGIGTTTPIRALHVNGELSLTRADKAAFINVSDPSGNGGGSIILRGLDAGGSTQVAANISLIGNTTGYGSILGNAENAALGIDNIGDSRLGFIKKAGFAPVLASSSGSPIVFSQTNQSGIFTNIAGATLAERMRISADGNVGIGTTSPVAKLHVGINGTSTNYGAYQSTDASLVLQNKASVNDNLNIIAFSDASGFGVADVGVITNHSSHLGKLFFATRPNASSYPIQRMLIDEKGYVGIANTSPTNRFQVGPNLAGYANNDLVVSNGNGTLAIHNDVNSTFLYGSKAVSIWSGNGVMSIYAQTNGNVGIGTTNPNQKLTVNGTIYGKEVKVDLNVPGPDYVFANNYQLQPLNELKTYIDQNKHLPEVPSAAAMEANGINLGEMNMLLLKKIEELTLYVIELKKENQNQDKTINDLLNKIKK